MANGRAQTGRKNGGNGNGKRTATVPRAGLTITRRFTTPDVHPYDDVEWERRKAQIVSWKGKVSFEQDDVEFPSTSSLSSSTSSSRKRRPSTHRCGSTSGCRAGPSKRALASLMALWSVHRMASFRLDGLLRQTL